MQRFSQSTFPDHSAQRAPTSKSQTPDQQDAAVEHQPACTLPRGTSLPERGRRLRPRSMRRFPGHPRLVQRLWVRCGKRQRVCQRRARRRPKCNARQRTPLRGKLRQLRDTLGNTVNAVSSLPPGHSHGLTREIHSRNDHVRSPKLSVLPQKVHGARRGSFRTLFSYLSVFTAVVLVLGFQTRYGNLECGLVRLELGRNGSFESRSLCTP